MKTYRKIDLYFMGDYLYSTNQSKTCKAARLAVLERLRTRRFYNSLVDRVILKYPHELKARFSK